MERNHKEQLNSCTQTVDFVNQGNDTSAIDVKKINMKMELHIYGFRGASISRSLSQHCNCPESGKGEFSYCEGGCVSWVYNGTHTECHIFVDLQLGSPPLVVDGGKSNKGPIPLSDDKEFERTFKLMGGISSKIFIILRM
ncbi:hypothetical protein H5410_003951 [Solanum commersonii]|uniref:Uncharacterized protein n=1 Tax=Solanum commersonii TaxID=4109 RepID=A0A9J6B6K8_SOLCO|nr:hypothetical protein H5410_003951 [Solanum commersonii]